MKVGDLVQTNREITALVVGTRMIANVLHLDLWICSNNYVYTNCNSLSIKEVISESR